MTDLVFQNSSPELSGQILLDLSIRSEIEEKDKAVDQIFVELLEKVGIPDKEISFVNLCIEEAVKNSIFHGNKLNPEKTVSIKLGATDEKWFIVLEDQGDGFKPEDIPEVTDEMASLFQESGRGIYLMRKFMDEIVYFNQGRGLYLSKQKAL